ncbi:MAG TPA: oxygenase MpaB family protein [Jatrophihabitans sp.]|jgi:uncharacterized protein (DUF2236 family)|nr:oxygenase MpaB family protein [Jatrophihabitans sp.]
MNRPGPESLVWQRLADDRGVLIGGATLLLQVAEPAVGAGVEQHSNFKAEPWRRLYGTLVSLTTIVYGSTAEACAEVQRLRAMHQSIRGVDAQGRSYAALRPAPWAWVHGTLAWAVIRLNEIFRTPLTDTQTEQYWREWLEVGRLLGVRDGDLPETYRGFLQQLDTMPLEDNPSVRDVVAAVSVIPPPAWLRFLGPGWRVLAGRPLGSVSRLVTIRALPPSLAARLGLRLTSREQRRLDRFVALVAGIRRALPAPLRAGPLAVLIKWRSRRRWDAPAPMRAAA